MKNRIGLTETERLGQQTDKSRSKESVAEPEGGVAEEERKGHENSTLNQKA